MCVHVYACVRLRVAGDRAAMRPRFNSNFKCKFTSASPAGNHRKAQLGRADLLHKQARPRQHVSSPSTPVCPSKDQHKVLTALFSWKKVTG